LKLAAISTVLLSFFSVQAVANVPVKIMPLGDSITLGAGSTSSNGYRKPLYLNLTAAGYNFNFVGSQTGGDFADPEHEGHSGWHADTTGNNDILGQIYNLLVANPTDIILLHIGTNDISDGGQDANEVSDILDEIDRFSTDIKVILALIINRQIHSPETTQFNIDVNNMAQNRIATGDDIIVVNMESALNYTTDMTDNMHPNDAGYVKMAEVWYKALVVCLQDKLEAVFYKANGWNFDVREDFAVKIDFHYSDISMKKGWVGICVGDDANYVLISVGSNGNGAYFYYEAVVDGNTISETEPRISNDGTLYVSYNATLKDFYLSHTGFGSQNAHIWQTPYPLQGQWTLPVGVSIGGGSFGVALGPGDAYLDNFEVVTAALLDWPPITDIDGNGFIEWDDLRIMCENWLDTGPDIPADIYKDEDNTVNFLDFAEFCPAW
jgi:lysophospholipase L1-like esterase